MAGATSAGKTTLLNALSQAIPTTERIVTIEETAELRLAQPHVVRLEARPPNAEGAGGVTVRALVRAALRMRPDRLVVGEVRGGEALDMLQALNTGHDGSMSTIHANGPGRRTVPARDARAPRRFAGSRSPRCARRWRRASTRSCSSPAGATACAESRRSPRSTAVTATAPVRARSNAAPTGWSPVARLDPPGARRPECRTDRRGGLDPRADARARGRGATRVCGVDRRGSPRRGRGPGPGARSAVAVAGPRAVRARRSHGRCAMPTSRGHPSRPSSTGPSA